MSVYVAYIGMLNDYLAYLLTVYDSSAVEDTKKSNVPFDKDDLAGIILNSVPVTWVKQYIMTYFTLPKSPCVLLLDLEAIKCVLNEKHQANLKIKVKEASTDSASAKGNPKKHSA